jgi:hypothetical protein
MILVAKAKARVTIILKINKKIFLFIKSNKFVFGELSTQYMIQ